MKVFSIIKKIMCWILLIIAIPIILFNLIIIAKSIINKNETPSVFGIKSFIILTGSMEPTINVGDIIFVKESNYNVNDIVSFRDRSSYVTHRIVRIDKNEAGGNLYYTKGDNNNIEDSLPINDSIIEGKVVKIIPKVGSIFMFIKKNLVAVFIGVIALYVLYDIVKRMAK